jgi:hypothetical protein
MDLTAFQELIKENCLYKEGDYVSFFADDLICNEKIVYQFMRTSPIVSATINKISISLGKELIINYEFGEVFGTVVQDKILGQTTTIITRRDGRNQTFAEVRAERKV